MVSTPRSTAIHRKNVLFYLAYSEVFRVKTPSDAGGFLASGCTVAVRTRKLSSRERAERYATGKGEPPVALCHSGSAVFDADV